MRRGLGSFPVSLGCPGRGGAPRVRNRRLSVVQCTLKSIVRLRRIGTGYELHWRPPLPPHFRSFVGVPAEGTRRAVRRPLGAAQPRPRRRARQRARTARPNGPARPRPSACSPPSRHRRGPGAVAGFDVVAQPTGAPPHRGRLAAGDRRSGLLDRPEEPRDGRPALPPPKRKAHAPGRRAARTTRPRRRRRQAGQDLLRRHAPTPRPRGEHRRRPARARSSTSRPPVSIPSAARTSGRCSATSLPTAPRSSSPRSTWKRPIAWPSDIVLLDHGATVAAGTPTS